MANWKELLAVRKSPIFDVTNDIAFCTRFPNQTIRSDNKKISFYTKELTNEVGRLDSHPKDPWRLGSSANKGIICTLGEHDQRRLIKSESDPKRIKALAISSLTNS